MSIISKYKVGDFITAIHNGLNNDSEYSFGQVISIESDKYVFKFVNNQKYKCDIKIIDSISEIIPTKTKMQLENPFEIYDFVDDLTSYRYFCMIQNDPVAFINSRTNSSIISIDNSKIYSQTQQVWISKCSHGRNCERLGCEKGPEFCPHGKGCERLACKSMY
jgi:hypothetical protein